MRILCRGFGDAHAALVAGGLALALTSCPAPNDPNGVDGRDFITRIFQASAECFPTFLAQAEPIFLDAQVRAQIDVAVDTFNRDLADAKVEFSRAAYDQCLKAADDRECDAINASSGACASVFRGKLNPGEVCAEGVECATGLSCFQDRDACGDCRVIAVEGRDCTAANCESGTFCNDSHVCQRKPEPQKVHEGDACSLATGCGGLLLGSPARPTPACPSTSSTWAPRAGSPRRPRNSASTARRCTPASATSARRGPSSASPATATAPATPPWPRV